ncbi:MAG: SUMF1/EgtB/PvdO family nonheme iron enzyme [Candidatus Brocadiaceae bacterium]|nr:SUMF1/EgtB/PvdO family nonheme iron enzyme [Candidatus Brocadiaceae bacterium]
MSSTSLDNKQTKESSGLELVRRLQLFFRDNSRSYIVLAVTDDSMLLSEVMGRLEGHLKGKYEIRKFDYVHTDTISLPRYCRTIQSKLPVCVFASGLDELKKRDPDKYYDEGLYFLNAHREDIINAKCNAVLWISTQIYADILKFAPDFAEWGKSLVLSLPSSEEDNALFVQAQRFEEMLSRPNLEPTLVTEFFRQLDYINKKRITIMRYVFGQLRDRTEINVFLASSGELLDERKELILILNSVEKTYPDLKFKPIILETDIPSGSYQNIEVQEEISPLLKETDIAIVLVHSKLGKFSLEEYELAKTKKKKIFIYLKTGFSPANKEELTNYSKVLEFKEKREQENDLLFKEFTNNDQLRDIVENDLLLYFSHLQSKKVLPKPDKTSGKTKKKKPVIPNIYKEWVTDHCRYMDINRLSGKGNVIQVRLPEIFIPLYAYPPKKQDGIKKGVIDETINVGLLSKTGRELGEYRDAVDIEKLVAENEYLLIEGEPGSGKTTLLKHISYNLAQNVDIKGLGGYIPVLILVEKLKGFFECDKEIKPKISTVEDILSYYFNNTENGLDINIVVDFCKGKKALFLLDGLDEIKPEYRKIIVETFVDFKSKHKGNKLVLTGRPHGIDSSTIDLFGDKHIKIQTLNMEQVEEFVNRWFCYIYHDGSKIGASSADSMIGELKTQPGIDCLIDNPLMLTAICILYYDGKELPGQRAELYKKFIENLIYKRFKDDTEQVGAFLENLAFKMHTNGVKGVRRAFAIDILKDIYSKEADESEQKYKKRIEDQFDLIESNCGLLKFYDGQYNFWHLTFQEFLTAVYLVDNHTDYYKAVEDYLGNPWYNEVVELYIGYLSIENKKWANKIVEKMLEDDGGKSFSKWLLSSKSLIDIHKDRRGGHALKCARKRLLEVIEEADEPKALMEAGETLGWLGDPRDLKKFVKVSRGEYKLREDKDRDKVEIEQFEIGKYLVTNSWFEEFIKDDGYKNRKYWSEEGIRWLIYNKVICPRHWNDRKWKCPNSPVVGVSWYEAYAFTRWLTIELKDSYEYRLPDEYEWEVVSAGPEGKKYPWGDKWDKKKCNNIEVGILKTSSVGVFREGNTPEEISDLSGNVWEWTTSSYYSRKNLNDFMFDKDRALKGENRELPVLRGGSWDINSFWCRGAYRHRVEPNVGGNDIGFRCARTLKF